MKTISLAYTSPFIYLFVIIVTRDQQAIGTYLWDRNNKETTSQNPKDAKSKHTTRVKSRALTHDILEVGNMWTKRMKHDVDTFTALNSIDTIPNDRHHSTIECRPPCSKDTKCSSVEDRITAGLGQ